MLSGKDGCFETRHRGPRVIHDKVGDISWISIRGHDHEDHGEGELEKEGSRVYSTYVYWVLYLRSSTGTWGIENPGCIGLLHIPSQQQ